MILMNDFKKEWKTIGAKVLTATEEVGQSGWYILGEEVKLFEKELAKKFGRDFCVGVANGMDAIEIGLRCLGVKPLDKVLTTALSAFATTLAILKVGAMPVFVDVDENGLIDLAEVEKALQSHSDIRFFIPVHLYGFSLDLDYLEDLQKKFNISVLEDCAQSIGAKFRQRGAGTVGRIAATSFYPTKNLGGMGDGGALFTDNLDFVKKAQSLRNYGQSEQYVHNELGLNSRLDELQAAILRKAVLPHLEDWTERRKGIAQRYLADIENPALGLPKVNSDMEPVWHLFPVRVAGDRRSFQNYLKEHDVSTSIHYPRLISDQAALRDYGRFEVIGQLSQAEHYASSQVSLPIHPFLSNEEVKQVVEVCNQWPG
jgi:dTDP-4-amino-4,6-dideoxygalactose transaminase